MKNPTILFGSVAVMMLSLGCSKASESHAKANEFGFEEQMLAILPVIKPGLVLKVCNTNDQPGDQGNLQFSLATEKLEPNNSGKLIPADLPSLEEQLAVILPLVDEHHALNIRSTTEKSSGQQRLVFTIEPREGV